MGTAAVSTVEGAVEAASKVGTSTTDAAREAVVGVLKAADDAGEEAGKTVRSALMAAASLPHDIVEKVIKGS